jgi:hypothetical protein
LKTVITTFSQNMMVLIDAGEETQHAMSELGRRLGSV